MKPYVWSSLASFAGHLLLASLGTIFLIIGTISAFVFLIQHDLERSLIYGVGLAACAVVVQIVGFNGVLDRGRELVAIAHDVCQQIGNATVAVGIPEPATVTDISVSYEAPEKCDGRDINGLLLDYMVLKGRHGPDAPEVRDFLRHHQDDHPDFAFQLALQRERDNAASAALVG